MLPGAASQLLFRKKIFSIRPEPGPWDGSERSIVRCIGLSQSGGVRKTDRPIDLSLEGPFMVRQACPEHSRRAHHERFDKPVLSVAEGLSTNGIWHIAFP